LALESLLAEAINHIIICLNEAPADVVDAVAISPGEQGIEVGFLQGLPLAYGIGLVRAITVLEGVRVWSAIFVRSRRSAVLGTYQLACLAITIGDGSTLLTLDKLSFEDRASSDLLVCEWAARPPESRAKCAAVANVARASPNACVSFMVVDACDGGE
jgi:hypothetical protein